MVKTCVQCSACILIKEKHAHKNTRTWLQRRKIAFKHFFFGIFPSNSHENTRHQRSKANLGRFIFDIWKWGERERERVYFAPLAAHREQYFPSKLAIGCGEMKPVCVRKMLLASNAPVKDTSLSAAAFYDRLVGPNFFFVSQTHLNHSHMPLVSFITLTGQPHSKETK